MKNAKGTLLALLAAVLYAISTPFSKALLTQIGPRTLAGLLYLGAGIGMAAVRLLRRKGPGAQAEPLTRGDLPFVLGMVALDIAAPILLLLGLQRTTAANAALLNNFEIVATSLIALLFFREQITKRLWAGIAAITAASALLTLEGGDSFSFSAGSLLVLLACLCWGLENNCTRRLSGKDAAQTVMIKGLGSGTGAMVVALCCGEALPPLLPALGALALGFVAYGLSIHCYIRAQGTLGAARTSAFYGVAPFIGAALSFALFRQLPGMSYWAALALMALGAWLAG